MTKLVQCDRCGGIIATDVPRFVSWYVTEDGQLVCPHCVTPAEWPAAAAAAASGPDEELLQALDPDNDRPDQTSTSD